VEKEDIAKRMTNSYFSQSTSMEFVHFIIVVSCDDRDGSMAAESPQSVFYIEGGGERQRRSEFGFHFRCGE
jgi:hypothetical protein